MSIKLRPYQKESSNECLNQLNEGKNVVYQLPTGGGKAVIIDDIVKKELIKRFVLASSNENDVVAFKLPTTDEYKISNGLIKIKLCKKTQNQKHYLSKDALTLIVCIT